MAKMFYSMEEVCEKLGKSEDEVKEMVKSGQIQEFRDRDKLMFKVDQIDLLAGGDEEDDSDDSELEISLEDTGGSGSGIALADSASGQSDSREGTGISVFDTDHGEEDLEQSDEESEDTQIGDTMEDELNLESVGSGSGLLDLTRESDETAVGAELLEDAYSSEDDQIDIPASASGLFEASEETPDEGAGFGEQPAAATAMMVEAYDGGGSGLGVGMMLGAAVALVCAVIIGMVGISGATPQLAMNFASNLWIWVGGLLGVTVVFGAIGWFIGRASE